MTNIDEILVTCRRTFRSSGVPRAQITAMLDELRDDLREVAANGGDPRMLTGDDVSRFAHTWAESRGVTRPQWRLLSTSAVAIAGTLPAVCFAAVLPLAGTSSWAVDLLVKAFPSQIAGTNLSCVPDAVTTCPDPQWIPPSWLIGVWFIGAVLLGYVGAVAAVGMRLRRVHDPAANATCRNLRIAIPAGVLALGIPMLWFNLSHPGTAFGDGGWVLAVTGCAIALVAATRAWAVLRTRNPSPKAQ